MGRNTQLMKRIYILLGVIALLGACKYGTYADLLKDEKHLISDFITRQQIHVIHDDPVDGVWNENDYLALDGYDNLYFHLVDKGQTDGDTVAVNDNIVVRYRKYTLNEIADTESYWTTLETPYPVEFKYGTDLVNGCTAWHVAVKKMRFNNAQCKIICPSKLGFSADNTSVTPYGYDMKIQIRKY